MQWDVYTVKINVFFTFIGVFFSTSLSERAPLESDRSVFAACEYFCHRESEQALNFWGFCSVGEVEKL